MNVWFGTGLVSGLKLIPTPLLLVTSVIGGATQEI